MPSSTQPPGCSYARVSGWRASTRVATEAGVSTRTIYERFKNKAELLEAVIQRLVDKDLARMFDGEDLDVLDLEAALTRFGHTICERMADHDSCALLRIVMRESVRFPELTARVRDGTKQRVIGALGGYLERQRHRGTVVLEDAHESAVLFMHMIGSTMEEHMLFGPTDSVAPPDQCRHVNRVVRLFMFGAVPRGDRVLPQDPLR